MIHTTVRRSRKFRRCGSCHGAIAVGDLYLEHVGSPGAPDGLGPDGWHRYAECGACAERYGRPISADSEPKPVIPE